VVRAIETIHGFENFLFAETGIFKSALLKPVVFDEIGLILLREPAILTSHFEQFGSGIRRGQRYLNAKYVQFLRKSDRVLDGLLRLNRQTENESPVNDDAGLMTGFRKAPHFIHRHALLDARQNVFIAAFISHKKQA